MPIITITSPRLLRLFGWPRPPAGGVKASWKLWWFWFWHPPVKKPGGLYPF